MKTYYELLENGCVGRSTPDANLAVELGLELQTDEQILIITNNTQGDIRMLESDCATYLESEEYKEKILNETKLTRLEENEAAKNVELIEISLGRLKTQTPLGDLKTVLPIYEKLAEANNGLPAGVVRLYNENNEQIPSPALNLEQFRAAILEIAMKYIEIDSKSTTIAAAIKAAQNLEELEGVEINY